MVIHIVESGLLHIEILWHTPGNTSPSPPGPSTTVPPDPQRWILETRPRRNTAGMKTCTDVAPETEQKKTNGWKTWDKKERTCAVQVEMRLLIRSRCMSTVSLSVICLDRHNSRTTCNNTWLRLRVNQTDRAAPESATLPDLARRLFIEFNTEILKRLFPDVWQAII